MSVAVTIDPDEAVDVDNCCNFAAVGTAFPAAVAAGMTSYQCQLFHQKIHLHHLTYCNSIHKSLNEQNRSGKVSGMSRVHLMLQQIGGSQ